MQKLKALLDGHAWLLILLALPVLAWLDWPMVRTLLEWTLYALVLIGLAIIVSRIVFPQINLARMVEDAADGNAAAGLVVLGLLVFFGLLVLALAGWVKP